MMLLDTKTTALRGKGFAYNDNNNNNNNDKTYMYIHIYIYIYIYTRRGKTNVYKTIVFLFADTGVPDDVRRVESRAR